MRPAGDSVELAVAAPLNAEQLWAVLLKKFPALAAHRASVRLARNLRIRRTGNDPSPTTMKWRLIPPVSGG